MDLNYLFHQQQIEHSLSKSATSEEARKAHARLAELYEQSIERLTKNRIHFGSVRTQTAIEVAA